MSDRKLEILQAPQRLGITVAETCHRYGISRETFYRWQRRYRAQGVEGLNERPRGPKAATLEPIVEELVTKLRRQHPQWGARRLRTELATRGVAPVPTTSTIHTVLKRNRLLSERTRRGKGRTPSGASTRQALIDAAMELWSVTGWRGTGITAVAQRAGVSDAGLLHHFDSKDNFLLEVVVELDRRTLDYWERKGPLSGVDFIRQIPDMTRPWEGEPAGVWKLRVMLQAENLDPTSPAYDYFVLRQRFIHDTFADAVRTGQEQGDIRADADPDVVATELAAFVMGIGFHIEHGPEHLDPHAISTTFINRLLRDLTEPPPVR